MRDKRNLLAVLAGFLALGIPVAQAADLFFNQAGKVGTYRCDGQDVTVDGAGNRLNFTGACRVVSVSGSANSVTVESAERIKTNGTNNAIFWKSGKAPVITKAGINNTVTREGADSVSGPAPSGASAVNETSRVTVSGDAISNALSAASVAAGVAGTVNAEETQGNVLNLTLSNKQITRSCGQSKDVNINGYGNEIALTGHCHQVAINGWGNHIYIEETPSIQLIGHDNLVTWERAAGRKQPAITMVSGQNNSVRQGALPGR